MSLGKEEVALVLAVQKVMSYSYRLIVLLRAVDVMDEKPIVVQELVPVPPLANGSKRSSQEQTEELKKKLLEQLAIILGQRPGTEISEIQVHDPQGNRVELDVETIMATGAVK